MNILIISNKLFHIRAEDIEQIKAAASGYTVTYVRDSDVTQEMVEKAEIIFGFLKPEQFAAAKTLQWLQLPSAGADYINHNLFYNKDLRITNSSGVYGLPIAEHVFSMILSFNHNLQSYAYHKADRKWSRIYEAKDFWGSTVGIIGLGDIGSGVAVRAKAWGAKVLAVKRTITERPEYVDELYTLEEIDEVLKQSDYVVLCLPGTAKTRSVITEERLRLMKPDSFLVNIGRGSLIDQEALIKALRENWIGGAGLDVMEPEPLPQDNPLWELPNVIITPHASGYSPTNDRRHFKIFYDNLKRYLEKKPLNNMVDLKEGY